MSCRTTLIDDPNTIVYFSKSFKLNQIVDAAHAWVRRVYENRTQTIFQVQSFFLKNILFELYASAAKHLCR